MKTKENLTEILIYYKLRITKPRLIVLECLSISHHSFSYYDIYAQVADKLDRVSLYRILLLFTEIGIFLKLRDGGGNMIYVYNHYINRKNALLTLLQCNSCEEISSLPDPPAAYINLLKNYQIMNPHFLFKGLCDKCRQKD